MIISAIIGALAGAMLIYAEAAAHGALNALSLWARSVVPTLGPFMLVMLLLSSRMGGGTWIRIGMGWLCGTPGGARLMAQLRPSPSSALRYAALLGTMSPMFFLGTLAEWLESQRAARIILLCHLLGALITGMALPRGKCGPSPSPQPLSLASALRQCTQALTGVALCMMLGSVAAAMARCALPRLPDGAAALLQCALEITAGTQAILHLGLPSPAPLLCAACSFGGLSLLLQSAAVWREWGVGMGRLMLLRLSHGLISYLLCLGAVKIL